MRRLQSLLARLPGGELHHHGQNRNRPPRRILGPKDQRMSGAPLPIEKFFSTQRRRDGRDKPRATEHIVERGFSLLIRAKLGLSAHDPVFSALPLRSLRLCVEETLTPCAEVIPAQRETQ